MEFWDQAFRLLPLPAVIVDHFTGDGIASGVRVDEQNRTSGIADRRDHLDLQINLLTERKVTQIIQMLDRLSLHVGVDQHSDPDSRELGRHVAVEHLVDALERRLPDAPRADTPS